MWNLIKLQAVPQLRFINEDTSAAKMQCFSCSIHFRLLFGLAEINYSELYIYLTHVHNVFIYIYQVTAKPLNRIREQQTNRLDAHTATKLVQTLIRERCPIHAWTSVSYVMNLQNNGLGNTLDNSDNGFIWNCKNKTVTLNNRNKKGVSCGSK